VSEAFYASLPPVDSFERLADSGSYAPLPDGWSLLAADIVSSTSAIEAGRYKNVNTVGVSVIAAVRNVVRPVDVPYVFGGDGALVCVPDRFADEARRAVVATIAMAWESFGLQLRACLVPVGYVRAQGRDLLVARHRVSSHYVQCALHGGGAELVERSLKRGGLPDEYLIAADRSASADYGGLECRWSEIPSPHDETVAVIVDALAPTGGPDAALPVYRAVMNRIREVYGDADACRPVERDGLSVTLAPDVLDNELKLRGWGESRAARIREAVALRVAVIVGWFLLRFGVRWGDVDWGSYERDLVVNTDFRKFDGSLRLVLAGTSAQREALTAYLEGLQATGTVAYGVHVARSALMTCLIEERQGAHFHFVDASGGGYAAAAASMKRAGGA